MHQIVVVAEPNDSRPIYLWRVLGLQLLAAGIARTKDGAWRQARLASSGRDGGMSLRPRSVSISVDGDVADE